jgi:hypothetical protein
VFKFFATVWVFGRKSLKWLVDNEE